LSVFGNQPFGSDGLSIPHVGVGAEEDTGRHSVSTNVKALKWTNEKTEMDERISRREKGEVVEEELVDRRIGDGKSFWLLEAK
jgi:hypothetical protein